MTSAPLDHNPSQFAPLVPSQGVAANAPRPHSSLSRGATYHHAKRNDGHWVGAPVVGCDRHTFPRKGWSEEPNRLARISTCEFSGVERRIAAALVADQLTHQLAFQGLAKRHPHIEVSVSASSFNASRISQKRRQGLAKVRRELVNFGQGTAGHD